MNEQQDRLFKLADLVIALGIKRGHNYALQVWHSMLLIGVNKTIFRQSRYQWIQFKSSRSVALFFVIILYEKYFVL